MAIRSALLISTGNALMTSHVIWKNLASVIALIAIGLQFFPAIADDKDPASGNIYWPPAKYTPAQLKSHIEKMQRVAPSARQAGYGDAMLAASDKLLDSGVCVTERPDPTI